MVFWDMSRRCSSNCSILCLLCSSLKGTWFGELVMCQFNGFYWIDQCDRKLWNDYFKITANKINPAYHFLSIFCLNSSKIIVFTSAISSLARTGGFTRSMSQKYS